MKTTLVIEDEMWKGARHAALDAGMSVNAWMVGLVEKALRNGGAEVSTPVMRRIEPMECAPEPTPKPVVTMTKAEAKAIYPDAPKPSKRDVLKALAKAIPGVRLAEQPDDEDEEPTECLVCSDPLTGCTPEYPCGCPHHEKAQP